jgi:hypothetical protein
VPTVGAATGGIMNLQTIRSTQSKAVALTVNTAERSISLAIRDGALAIATIVDAGIATGLAAEVGHEAITDLLGGIQQMADSRTQFIKAHRNLAAIGRKMGLSETDWGDGSAKAENLQPAPRLSVAA